MTIDWSKTHCGLIACDPFTGAALMPEIAPLLKELESSGMLKRPLVSYLIDVKVHMLMPGQYPCIPGWHCDFVPRDENGVLMPDRVRPEHEMYLWLSGAPLTEFRSPDGAITKVDPETWVPFTQVDEHRGVMAEEHGWRCFIRVAPKDLVPKRVQVIAGVRRHSQVYIEDPNNFTW